MTVSELIDHNASLSPLSGNEGFDNSNGTGYRLPCKASGNLMDVLILEVFPSLDCLSQIVQIVKVSYLIRDM